MSNVTVTYHAPKGDEKVVEIFGQTFFDGQSSEVDLDARAIGKLKKNQHFEISGEDDAEDPEVAPTPEKVRGKPGRKPKQPEV